MARYGNILAPASLAVSAGHNDFGGAACKHGARAILAQDDLLDYNDIGWCQRGEILLTDRAHLPEKYRLIFDLDDGVALAVNVWKLIEKVKSSSGQWFPEQI